MVDQASKLREKVRKKKAGHRPIKVISVTSGKGGVGKTQVVANLALALRERNKEVLIFDGDMGLANIDILYNINPPYNLSHLIKGEKTVNEVIFEGPGGVMVLPAASGIQEMTNLSAESRGGLIDQLDQLEGLFDYVLIDTAAGISENVMYLNTSSQFIAVVVTPEPTSITDAYALIKVLATQYNEQSFQIITNQMKNEQEGKAIFNSLVNATDQFLESVQLWHLHNICFDEKVRQSITRQEPMIKLHGEGTTASSYRSLAEKVEALELHRSKGGMQFFLKQALSAGS